MPQYLNILRMLFHCPMRGVYTGNIHHCFKKPFDRITLEAIVATAMQTPRMTICEFRNTRMLSMIAPFNLGRI